ncbi:protein dcl chloroplastic [Phtheirospermum japonicum]|uniref:Protein dcl chloroplastic n=1 Tax=Phtheirospermum japonicum TaxID=374723 RepID=A0A830BWK7_9LAMI|nr:protein dcl chloroplastic [Phtheirospermum japonicum]
MADEATPEVPMEHEPKLEVAADPMPVEEDSENGGSKRAREEDEEQKENEEKKAKVENEKAVEEKGLESSGDGDGKMEEDGKESDGATVGPKTFGSSVEIFDYFFKLLHAWPTNLNLNKYEHIMLLDLLKKGHLEAERKIGKGVKAFQVRYHPQFKSRCFFLTRDDESVDDFSFRKCVDHILPLPENMHVKNDVNKALRGKGGGRGRGRGRGRGGGR